MPLLYYWRGDNYRRDLDMGASYHLNQSNPLLHSLDIGDSLWAFTRTEDGIYSLAAELIVHAKTYNPKSFRYGQYRVWGHLDLSRYFKIGNENRVEVIIRNLSCSANALVLGRSFQGRAAVRSITLQDHQILSKFAEHLRLEPRARILPEEKLEASLVYGDPTKIQRLIAEEKTGVAEVRAKYLYVQVAQRSRGLVDKLQEIYTGRCQICRWDPKSRYHHHLSQGHHLQWLSRGGSDSLSNMVLVCPNHHAAIHRVDGAFDYADLSFAFMEHREKLVLNAHL